MSDSIRGECRGEAGSGADRLCDWREEGREVMRGDDGVVARLSFMNKASESVSH
jgi:hypothetical protein